MGYIGLDPNSSTGSLQAAQGYADQAQAVLEEINGTFYGIAASDPAVDPNGNAPTEGDTYFNSTTEVLMVREGYVPRTRQRDLERMASDALGAIAESHSNALRGAEQIAETRSRAAQRVQEYRKEVDSMLADVRREVQPYEQKLNAAAAELKRMVVIAPASGQVVGLMEQTEGGVIPAGVKLMDIVPQNEALIIDARIPTNLIDRIQQGLKTDVRFSAFAHNPSLVVKGLVTSISSDTLTDARTGAAYYLGRVEITPEGMAQLGQNQMQPGMPVEVVFQTGERTLLTYLLNPFLKRLAGSLKEH